MAVRLVGRTAILEQFSGRWNNGESKKKEIFAGPLTLPIVRFWATRFFADLRRGQFRDINYPHNYMFFDSEQGWRICRQNGVITCTKCGTGAIVSTALDTEELRSVRCYSLIVPLFGITAGMRC